MKHLREEDWCSPHRFSVFILTNEMMFKEGGGPEAEVVGTRYSLEPSLETFHAHNQDSSDGACPTPISLR